MVLCVVDGPVGVYGCFWVVCFHAGVPFIYFYLLDIVCVVVPFGNWNHTGNDFVNFIHVCYVGFVLNKYHFLPSFRFLLDIYKRVMNVGSHYRICGA